MNLKRLNVIGTQVKSLHRLMSKKGFFHANKLIRISLMENDWLAKNGRQSWLPYTTVAEPSFTWKTDMDRPIPAKRPVVREIWVGARSLASADKEDDSPFSMSAEQEDIAELTDMQLMLYHGYEQIRNAAALAEARRLYRKVRRKHPEFTKLRRKKLWKLAKAQAYDDFAHTAVIEDPETGQPRFIRPGDVIQVAWGSHEDLDALYMEEPADERSEADSLGRMLDRDQVPPPPWLEQAFRDDPDFAISKLWLVEREYVDEASAENLPDWVGRSDYFDSQEANMRQRNRILKR